MTTPQDVSPEADKFELGDFLGADPKPGTRWRDTTNAVAAAQAALKLKPNSASAFNRDAAASTLVGKDKGARAALKTMTVSGIDAPARWRDRRCALANLKRCEKAAGVLAEGARRHRRHKALDEELANLCKRAN